MPFEIGRLGVIALGGLVGWRSKRLVGKLCRITGHFRIGATADHGWRNNGRTAVWLGGGAGRDCDARRDGVRNHHV
eukprot:6189247-Pleurochrysis_carterae.AAC.8